LPVIFLQRLGKDREDVAGARGFCKGEHESGIAGAPVVTCCSISGESQIHIKLPSTPSAV
jgi:hypothetical protein